MGCCIAECILEIMGVSVCLFFWEMETVVGFWVMRRSTNASMAVARHD
jgi:hypothetical protein